MKLLVGIHQVELVVCLPLDWEHFSEQAERGGFVTGFINKYDPYHSRGVRYCFNRYRSALLDELVELLGDIERLGAAVTRGGDERALRVAFANRQFVSVLGHHQPANIEPNEGQPAEAFVSSFGSHSDPAVQSLFTRFGLRLDRPRQSLATLVDVVRATTTAFDVLPEKGAPLSGVSRVWLERTFPRYFEEVPCWELLDGLKTTSEFSALVPTYWSGMGDLSICNSSLLAEALKRRASGASYLGAQWQTQLLYRVRRFVRICQVLHRFSTADLLRVVQLMLEEERKL